MHDGRTSTTRIETKKVESGHLSLEEDVELEYGEVSVSFDLKHRLRRRFIGKVSRERRAEVYKAGYECFLQIVPLTCHRIIGTVI